MKKLYIPIILGTRRAGRESEKVANLILSEMQKHDEIETELFDVRDFDLPMDDEGTSLREANPKWRDSIIRADGLVIIAPEYNHSFPGSLKMALDTILEEYVHKAVGLVGVSAGFMGGARGIESLVPVVRELGLAVTFSDLYFPKVHDSFNEDGSPKDEGVYKRIGTFLDELLFMSKSLRWGRENVPNKYHSK